MKQIEDKLRVEMSEQEFFPLLAEIVAGIGCGHTYLMPSSKLEETISHFSYLPLEIMFIDKKANIVQIHGDSLVKIGPGDEILEINGHPMDSIMSHMRQYLSHDGSIETGFLKQLASNFGFYYSFYVETTDRYTVVAKHKGGEIKTVSLAGVSSSERETYRRKSSSNRSPQDNIHLSFHPTLNTAILSIKRFKNWKSNGKKKNFRKELQASFEQIETKQVDHLILDLRGNGGGAGQYGHSLLSYLLTEPFIEFKEVSIKTFKPEPKKLFDFRGVKKFLFQVSIPTDKINDTCYLVKNERNLELCNPSTPHYKGKIYVLIDGVSFSATSDVCVSLHTRGRAIFIGEETGGGYMGNSSKYSYRLSLPHTDFTLNIPAARYVNNIQTSPENHGRGTIPDYPVQPTIEDVLAGIDRPMRFTLEMIQTSSED